MCVLAAWKGLEFFDMDWETKFGDLSYSWDNIIVRYV